MGLKWLERVEESLHIWIRTWIYWNVWGIGTLESWIVCGWTFLFQLLSKWLQIFKSPDFLHQPNMIASLLNDSEFFQILGSSYVEFDVNINVLGGWVCSLLSLECKYPWTYMVLVESQHTYKIAQVSENIGDMWWYNVCYYYCLI